MVAKNTSSTEAGETTAGYILVRFKNTSFSGSMPWKNQTVLKLEIFSVFTGVHSPKMPENMLGSELAMGKLS